MSWYHDPESVAPPSASQNPPNALAQPGRPQQPQVGYPASPGPPLQSPPPFPPNPPTGSPLPREIPPILRKPRTWIAVGVVLVLLLVAGFTYRSVTAPEELSTRLYAKALCSDILKPASREIQDVVEDARYQPFGRSEVNSESDARKAIEEVRKVVRLTQVTVGAIGRFNDEHRLRGREGEEFHAEMASGLEEFNATLAEAIDAIDVLDPADEEDVVSDLGDALKDTTGLDVSVDGDDPGGSLLEALNDRNSECGLLFAGLVDGAGNGD